MFIVISSDRRESRNPYINLLKKISPFALFSRNDNYNTTKEQLNESIALSVL